MVDFVAASTDNTYRRTLRLGVSVAAQLALPGKVLRGGHSIGEGFSYRAVGTDLSDDDVKAVEAKLQELISSGASISQVSKPWKEALAYFESHKLECAAALLKSRVSEQVECLECQGVLRLKLYPVADSFATLSERSRDGDGAPAAKAARKATIKLVPCSPGFIASYAVNQYIPQPALVGSFNDNLMFSESLGVSSVGALNQLQQVGRGRKDYVLQCEFRQEQKLGTITNMVLERQKAGKQVKVICIAGPTSSGKTTFANKLCMYLRNAGFQAKPLTVDHYYLPLDRQPKYQARKQRSDVDYDHIESMDVDLVGEHLNKLAAGESVLTPVYNMKTGYRVEPGKHFEALPSNGILVIEGIHALNPLYTRAVDANKVFKIFISPLTALQIDDANAVKTTDHRLLRRMCRDYLFRANSASITLGMWDNVRKGEGVWIFPHQNNADFVMNSAADYEVPVLKTFIEPLLRQVTTEDKNYEKCKELLTLLERFGTFPPDLTPASALLREFIGDGAFDEH